MYMLSANNGHCSTQCLQNMSGYIYIYITWGVKLKTKLNSWTKLQVI